MPKKIVLKDINQSPRSFNKVLFERRSIKTMRKDIVRAQEMERGKQIRRKADFKINKEEEKKKKNEVVKKSRKELRAERKAKQEAERIEKQRQLIEKQRIEAEEVTRREEEIERTKEEEEIERIRKEEEIKEEKRAVELEIIKEKEEIERLKKVEEMEQEKVRLLEKQEKGQSIKKELEAQKQEIRRKFSILSNQKKPYREKIFELLKEIKKVQLLLEPIIKKEKAIEEKKQKITEKEKKAKSPESQKSLEEKRWQIERKRRQVETERWKIEITLEKIDKVLKENDGHYQEILSQEQLLKKQRQEIKREESILEMESKKQIIEEALFIVQDKLDITLREKREIESKINQNRFNFEKNEKEEFITGRRINNIEERERIAPTPRQKRIIEKKRWTIEQQRERLAKNKRSLMKEIRSLNIRLKEKDSGIKSLLREENKIKEQLKIIEEFVHPGKLKELTQKLEVKQEKPGVVEKIEKVEEVERVEKEPLEPASEEIASVELRPELAEKSETKEILPVPVQGEVKPLEQAPEETNGFDIEKATEKFLEERRKIIKESEKKRSRKIRAEELFLKNGNGEEPAFGPLPQKIPSSKLPVKYYLSVFLFILVMAFIFGFWYWYLVIQGHSF